MVERVDRAVALAGDDLPLAAGDQLHGRLRHPDHRDLTACLHQGRPHRGRVLLDGDVLFASKPRPTSFGVALLALFVVGWLTMRTLHEMQPEARVMREPPLNDRRSVD